MRMTWQVWLLASVAVRWWRPEVAQILLRRGAPPGAALLYAAQVHCFDQAKRMDMLKMLVEAGADVRQADADHRLINVAMFHNGQWDVIDYLHSRGASVGALEPVKHGSHLLAEAVAAGGMTTEVPAPCIVSVAPDV